jgi:hypothetical protein
MIVSLSTREAQALQGVIDGKGNKLASDSWKRVCRKFQCDNPILIFRECLKYGLLDSNFKLISTNN